MFGIVSSVNRYRHRFDLNTLQCEGFGEFPSMVSAWYDNGHVMAYLQNLGKAATVQRRLKLVSLPVYAYGNIVRLKLTNELIIVN